MTTSGGAGSGPGLFEIMYNMRSMRRLKPDPIPEEVLLRLIEAATRAPNGGNNQLWRWIIVRDRAQKERLAEVNRASRPPGPPAPPADPNDRVAARTARQRAAGDYLVSHLQDVPAIIVACSVVNPSLPAEARRTANAGAIWPAVENLLLAARALGLGALPTGFGLGNRDAAREILALPNNVEAHVTIPVGYPIGRFGPVTRLPVEAVTRFDRWSD